MFKSFEACFNLSEMVWFVLTFALTVDKAVSKYYISN